MASIDNEYVVRLFCVCLGTRMMLVSEFMPFGSLKYHLKEFKSEINAKTLLTFAAQVASVCIVIKAHGNELRSHESEHKHDHCCAEQIIYILEWFHNPYYSHGVCHF